MSGWVDSARSLAASMAAASSLDTPSDDKDDDDDDNGEVMLLSSRRRPLVSDVRRATSTSPPPPRRLAVSVPLMARCSVPVPPPACSTDGGGGGRLSRDDGGKSTSSSGGGGGKNSTASIRHLVTLPLTSRSDPGETVTSSPGEMKSLCADDLSGAWQILVAMSDDFLVCLGNVGGASLVETGDEVPRPACGVCDGGRSDIGGSLTGTD